MEKILVACQECKIKTDPDASTCYRCGYIVTPETIEIGKRYQQKTSMLTMSFFMIFFIPFGIFLVFDGMRQGEISGGRNPCEIALGVGLLLAAFVESGYVVFLLFLKKK